MKKFNLEEYIEKLEYLVNIDSGSKTPEGVKKVADYIEDQYKTLGLSVKRHTFSKEAGPCLEIRNRPEAEKIDVLLVGHMDTVFPEGTAAVRPFTREGNLAYGPGVADMKSGVISMLYLVAEILEEKLNVSFCVALNSDEEISSRYSSEWLKRLARSAEYAFLLEPGRKNGEFVSERKGLAKYQVKAHGIAAHAGAAPQDGASAIHKLAHLITEIIKLNDYEHGTSLNVGTIGGGTTANVVSEHAECLIDTRFERIEEHDKIEAALEKLKENPVDGRVQIEYTTEGFRPPMTVSEKTIKLMGWMDEMGASLGMPMKWLKTGGASDGNFIAFEGCATVDGAGPSGEGFHSDREIMQLNTVSSRIQLLLDTIAKISREKEGR